MTTNLTDLYLDDLDQGDDNDDGILELGVSASDLNWEPGFWPTDVRVLYPDGTVICLTRTSDLTESGAEYVDETNETYLTVYND